MGVAGLALGLRRSRRLQNSPRFVCPALLLDPSSAGRDHILRSLHRGHNALPQVYLFEDGQRAISIKVFIDHWLHPVPAAGLERHLRPGGRGRARAETSTRSGRRYEVAGEHVGSLNKRTLLSLLRAIDRYRRHA